MGVVRGWVVVVVCVWGTLTCFEVMYHLKQVHYLKTGVHYLKSGNVRALSSCPTPARGAGVHRDAPAVDGGGGRRRAGARAGRGRARRGGVCQARRRRRGARHGPPYPAAYTSYWALWSGHGMAGARRPCHGPDAPLHRPPPLLITPHPYPPPPHRKRRRCRRSRLLCGAGPGVRGGGCGWGAGMGGRLR